MTNHELHLIGYDFAKISSSPLPHTESILRCDLDVALLQQYCQFSSSAFHHITEHQVQVVIGAATAHSPLSLS
jgi:hypothetical protein